MATIGRNEKTDSRFLLKSKRPAEELYDLKQDPDEIHNLADDPQFAATLAALRQQLDDWMETTGDQGRTPESPEMYDSDMTVYTERMKNPKFDPAHLKVIEDNIALMKQWAKEGK